MEFVENKTMFKERQIIMPAKRENNKKRSFLLVNPLQGKHVPASPTETTSLFESLGLEVKKAYPSERLLVIGFAETATAIGAVVARICGEETFYIHTTREEIKDVKKMVDFSEEHSHATEQMLYCNHAKEVLQGIDRIVFVEDEITTGKTILNFIHAMEKGGYINDHISLSVASIVNAMNSEHLERFQEAGIKVHYLVKIHKKDLEKDLMKFNEAELGINENLKPDEGVLERVYKINGKINPRIGTNIKTYEDSCEKLSDEVIQMIGKENLKNGNVLVLGTEECMYPAIHLGKMIFDECDCEVHTHSTTRSPILPIHDEDYPLQSRYCLSSFYDDNRNTYLYNLKSYDCGIIVTDSESVTRGYSQLYSKLTTTCKSVYVVQWIKE